VKLTLLPCSGRSVSFEEIDIDFLQARLNTEARNAEGLADYFSIANHLPSDPLNSAVGSDMQCFSNKAELAIQML
jgi:hypothetical protein